MPSFGPSLAPTLSATHASPASYVASSCEPRKRKLQSSYPSQRSRSTFWHWASTRESSTTSTSAESSEISSRPVTTTSLTTSLCFTPRTLRRQTACLPTSACRPTSRANSACSLRETHGRKLARNSSSMAPRRIGWRYLTNFTHGASLCQLSAAPAAVKARGCRFFSYAVTSCATTVWESFSTSTSTGPWRTVPSRVVAATSPSASTARKRTNL
mmetsp:Transcript_28315/g.67008  ORF Transcript_28315/g.67008 Transcript_28315/m.67008 type:complete len:214 (+) Transcript_28315:290-931(+)